MVEFGLSSVHAGWACATIADGSKEVTIAASYVPTDAIRDFVDAVASLQSAACADCCWYQEPGEIQWHLVRSAAEISIEVVSFDGMPRQDTGSGTTLFKATTQWLQFCTQVVETLIKLRDSMGSAYEREWRYPFPHEACEKLNRAIRAAERGTERCRGT